MVTKRSPVNGVWTVKHKNVKNIMTKGKNWAKWHKQTKTNKTVCLTAFAADFKSIANATS